MAAEAQDKSSFLKEMEIKPRVLNGRIILHTDQEEGWEVIMKESVNPSVQCTALERQSKQDNR